MSRRNFGSLDFNNMPARGYGSNIQQQYHFPRSSHHDMVDRQPTSRRTLSTEVQPNRTSVLELPPLGNTELPIMAFKDRIIESIDANQLTIIIAETGGGKSTQTPQFALEAGYTVIQTQPRRIAARQLADRIGEEITTSWPDAPRDVSGFHTAEKNTCTDETLVRNVTDGLLLAQDSGASGRAAGEKELVIIDEVHEWGINVEMELGFVFEKIKNNPECRFVIQSATLDAERLQEFFADALGGELPSVIEVPGRMYPVERQEFADDTVVERALLRAEQMHRLDVRQRKESFTGDVKPTGFVVTAPGKREIKDFIDEIRAGLSAEVASSAVILPLHSKMSDAEQNMAMRTDYPGIKIIVATDVMKTSLTVPGLAGVIDCGYARHEDIDERYLQNLPLFVTSKADCSQWAGRAGRLAPGWYDLARMNDDMPFIPFDERDDYEQPASQRMNPINEVLMTASMGVDFSDWKIPHPIREDVVDYAKESLRILGALDEENKITAIGRRMRDFPLGSVSARMMVEADRHSPQVRSYIAAIVSIQEAGGLPLYTQGNGREWQKLVSDGRDSDLIAQLDVFIAIQNEHNQSRLQRLDLDVKNLERARETYWRTVRRADGDTDELILPSQDECAAIKSCIYAGMPDGMYQYAGDGLFKGVGTRDNQQRSLSDRSVVRGKHSFVAGTGRQIEHYTRGEKQTKEILELVTVIDDVRALGGFALKRSQWVPTGEMVWHNGRPQTLVRQHLDGIDLGVIESVPPNPGAEVQQFLVEHVLENPGFEQRRLRGIKKELEQLNHLTYGHVPQLTQDDLIQLLYEAAPIDLLDAPMIDVNLQLMGIERGDYISDEDRQRIIDASPSRIVIGGNTLTITYRGGRPVVRRYDMSVVIHGAGALQLDDGRDIYFVYNRQEYTAEQLRSLPV